MGENRFRPFSASFQERNERAVVHSEGKKEEKMARKTLGWMVGILWSLGLAAQAPRVSFPELLEKARSAFAHRSAASQARAAVRLYAEAAAADGTSYEARWEGARACYYLGIWADPEESDREKLALFEDGIARAKAAVALRPDGPEGHFWLGVLYGVYGETKGIFKSLSLVPDIQREMEACLRLDRTVEGFGPDRLLGRLYFKLPGFKGGDNEKSIAHLKAAVEGEPRHPLSRLYLAETLKAEGRKEEAREQLRAILSMDPDPRWAAEYPAIRAQAEALLRKLGG